MFDWDDPEEGELFQTNDFIGSATLILNPLVKEQEVTLELRDQKGKAGTVTVHVQFQKSSDAVKSLVERQYVPFEEADTVKEMLKNCQTQSVCQAKASYGFKPKYPIMIIPGLASSALEAWESPRPAWIRERVWVDPFKIGKMAVAQKLSTKLSTTSTKRSMSKILRRDKSKKKEVEAVLSSETDDEQVETLNSDQRLWLRHILTAPDGFSDPPGIKLRPVQGLAAIDYLASHPLARKASYVFGHVLHELAMVGYTPKNLDAAPNLWVLYGTNLNTEVSYYFKPHKNDNGRYVLDVGSDKYSEQKIGGINPRGLRIVGGIGFETPQTFQANVRANKSGDGTVPYCSLSYAFKWQEMAEAGNLPLKHVRVTEIDGADHREMLNNAAVFDAIISRVCEKPIS